MKFDDLIEQLGEFGTYQKRQYVLVMLPKILVGFQMVITVFIAGVPFHRCSLPGWQNDTYQIQNPTQELFVNRTIPMVVNSDGQNEYSKCKRYKVTEEDILSGEADNMTGLESCSEWVYDKSVFKTTVVTKLDLVCDKVSYRSHAQMVFMGGVLIGSIVFGILADILGRKTCICIAVMLQATSGVAAAFAPEFYSFCILRLLNGASNAAVMINSFVLVTEIVGPKKRRWSGILIMYAFTFGYILAGGMAYFIRDWKYLQLVSSAPGALFLVYWWVLPESPRWLLAKGRTDEARQILKKMARVNNAELTEKMLDSLSIDNKQQKTESITKIFTSKVLVFRALVSCFNWMVVSMMYYGLSLNSGNLVGNLHLNFVLSGLVEIPAYICLIWAVTRIGRRPLHCSMMIVGGTACVSTLFPVLYADKSMQWITITLSLIGKFCATSAFASIYIVTSEIFPTVIRNGAMGAGSMCARIGGMLAPYIADLGDYFEGNIGQAVPLITFGVSAILAGCLSLLLPETFNRQLPETIEDGINFGRNQSDSEKKKKPSEFMYTNPDITLEDEKL